MPGNKFIEDGQWKLVCQKTGAPASVGTPVSYNQEPGWYISGGKSPQHNGSTGRVYLANDVTGLSRIFFPSVVDHHWIYLPPRTEADRRIK